MLTKKKYSIKDMVFWTRWETMVFFIIALIPTVLYELAGLKWLHLPWTPIALIGTAVAFLISFQSNAAYDRIWEARKIWGGIVNSSRSWTMMVKDMITNEHAQQIATEKELYEQKKKLVHRHIAWLSAMRHAMRKVKPWEVFMESKTNKEWSEMYHVPERENKLEDDIKPILSQEEYQYVLQKTNKAAALLSLQSKHLRDLKEKGYVWEFSFLELESILVELFNLQGKSERIKNFPYPRQFATLGYDFVWIFILLLPFAVVPEFSRIGANLSANKSLVGDYFVWASIPFIVIVSWVFHTMQRIGTVGENPFEGSANDVPISTIARGIEIDIREMIDEGKENIPDPLKAVYNVQM
jgi:putative membrane protein